MPIYEYECPSCGQFEVTQRITEESLTRCPHCKKRKVRKLMSNTSFQLKGSGWYITDYARKGGASGPGSGEAKGPGESSGEAKGAGEAKGSGESKGSSESSGESKSASKSGEGKGKTGKKENKAA
jgi:putative FmdB family regulatory protein